MISKEIYINIITQILGQDFLHLKSDQITDDNSIYEFYLEKIMLTCYQLIMKNGVQISFKEWTKLFYKHIQESGLGKELNEILENSRQEYESN